MVITELFPDYGRESCKTGNVLITGISNMGAEGCFDQLFGDVLQEKNPVFYFDDRISYARSSRIRRLAEANGYSVMEVSDRLSGCAAFNLLGLYDTAAEKAEAVYAFISTRDDSYETVETVCRYLRDCILVLEDRGREYTVDQIFRLRVEDVKAGISRCRLLSDYEIEDEYGFLESRDVYRCWGLLNDRSKKLYACGMIPVLSGRRNPMDVFRGPVLLQVTSSVDTVEAARTYSFLLNGLIHMLTRVCEMKSYRGSAYHVFLHECRSVRAELLEALLQVGMNAPQAVPVCMVEQNIMNLVNIHGSGVLDYFHAFCIFKTHEGQLWSEFLGTMLMPDRTENYSQRRSLLGLPAGGVVMRNRYKSAGVSIHRVEKPLYEPRVFQSLEEKTMIFYNVYKNRKIRKKLSW